MLTTIMGFINALIALIIPVLPGVAIKKGAKFSAKKMGLFIIRRAYNNKSDVFVIDGHVISVHTDVRAMGKNTVAQLSAVEKDHVKVTVDGLFWFLSQDIRHCILAHELGHAVVREAYPTKPARYGLARIVGVCPKEELVADTYALSIYGKEAMLNTLSVMCLLSPSLEMIQRIVNIVRK